MEVAPAFALFFLPVVIYFVRAPEKVTIQDVLVVSLLLLFCGAPLAALDTFFFKSPITLVIGWLAACGGAWYAAEKERSEYKKKPD